MLVLVVRSIICVGVRFMIFPMDMKGVMIEKMNTYLMLVGNQRL